MPKIVSGKLQGRLSGNRRNSMTALGIVARIEAAKASNLAMAVAARKRLVDEPSGPTFEERGCKFCWEQVRAVVGPVGRSPETVAWWPATLKKIVSNKKWQDGYINRKQLTPTAWIGDETNKYLVGLTADDEAALTALGGLKQLPSGAGPTCAAQIAWPVQACWCR